MRELRVCPVGRAVQEERAADRISEGTEQMWCIWKWLSSKLPRVRSIREEVNNRLKRSSKAC